MYAQTIACSLLAARIVDAEAARTTAIDFGGIDVSEVVDLLDQADMDAVVRDFANRKPLEDPVIHFYELFLKEYDPKKRMQRGVFYTPRPVVSFIVRAVDELLRREFGLTDGLADTSTWAEVAGRVAHLPIPEGVSPGQDFVRILDPAAGTGTFLVEAIGSIHRTLTTKWRAQGHDEDEIEALWNAYVPKHLLTRLHGYELLMAPYAIAHLAVGLALRETGYRFGSDERARVSLTNALDRARGGEGCGPFTVILGNPPYANYSANLSAEARRIVDRYRTFNGAPIRERNQLQFERNIQDDFVKFIALAQDAIVASGAGVIGYITNATMLASPSLRGMRQSLVEDFDSIHELHLHGGSNRRNASDENVFDIVQSVAIHVYARTKPGGASVIKYADVYGTRAEKHDALAARTLAARDWQSIALDLENCGFVPRDVEDAEGADGDQGAEAARAARAVRWAGANDRVDDQVSVTANANVNANVNAHRRLDSVFVQYGGGIKTSRDAVVIAFDDESLLESVRAFDARLVTGVASTSVADEKPAAGKIHPLLYRPFDVRRIFFDEDLVASRSVPTMRHVLAGPNIGFVCSSSWTTPDRFSVGVSRCMVEMKAGTHDRGTTFFPLYRYEDGAGRESSKRHNFTPEFVREWCDATGTTFVPSGRGRGDGVTTTGPEDVFYWLYALFYAPGYQRRYRAALAQGFPIVLPPSGVNVVRTLAGLGEELAALHLLESERLNEPHATFTGSVSTRVVTKVGWTPDNAGTVWIDGKGTSRSFQRGTAGFCPVPEAVWTMHMAGYQVCEKWLKDRRGRRLSDDEIIHYIKIIGALTETPRLMQEIDAALEGR